MATSQETELLPPLEISSRFFQVVHLTHQGLRAKNEDTVMVWVPSTECGSLGVFVVADGLGGHLDGGIASKLAAEEVVRLRQEGTADLAGAVLIAHELIEEKNRAVPHAGDRALMGTTLSVVELSAPSDGVIPAQMVNVGDSRVYLIRGGGVEQLTVDDINSQYGSLDLVLGAGTELQFVDHSTRQLELFPDDVLLLASDGLHKHLSADAIGNAVSACNGDIRTALTRLMKQALFAEDGQFHLRQDNTTGILMRMLQAA